MSDSDDDPIVKPGRSSTAPKSAQAHLTREASDSDDKPLGKTHRPTTTTPQKKATTDLDTNDEQVDKPQRKKLKTKTGTAKRKLPDNVISGQTPPTLTTGTGLDKITIAIDHRTNNIKRWQGLLDQGLQMKPKAAQKYTPTLPAPRSVLDLTIYDGRQFEVLEKRVEQYEVDRSGVKTKVWRLEVQDKSKPKSKATQLYYYPPRIQNIPGQAHVKLPDNNALDVATICPTYQDAIRLGEVACSVMNRFPGPLDIEKWNKFAGTGFGSAARKFVEFTALMVWNPSLNTRDLHTDFVVVDESKKQGKYDCLSNVYDTNKAMGFSQPSTIYVTDATTRPNQSGTNIQFTLDPSDVDPDSTKDIEVMPDTYAFKATYNGTMFNLKTDKRASATLKAF